MEAEASADFGICGEFSSSMATVKNWFNQRRPSAPNTAATVDDVTKIYDLILTDHYLKELEIAEIVAILKTVGMKYRARWVPHLFTPENKPNREITSQQFLTPLKCNTKEFLHGFVTVDEM